MTVWVAQMPERGTGNRRLADRQVPPKAGWPAFLEGGGAEIAAVVVSLRREHFMV